MIKRYPIQPQCTNGWELRSRMLVHYNSSSPVFFSCKNYFIFLNETWFWQEVGSILEQSPKFLSHTYPIWSTQISAILGLFSLFPTPLQPGVGLVEVPMVDTLGLLHCPLTLALITQGREWRMLAILLVTSLPYPVGKRKGCGQQRNHPKVACVSKRSSWCGVVAILKSLPKGSLFPQHPRSPFSFTVEQWKCIVSQSWRPEGWDEGVGLVGSFWGLWLCGRPGFHPWFGKIPWRRKWHSSTLAWKVPWMEEPGGLQFLGSQRVGHDWATSLSLVASGGLLAVTWLVGASLWCPPPSSHGVLAMCMCVLTCPLLKRAPGLLD